MLKLLLLMTFIFTCCCNARINAAASPVGLWKTIDDVTGKPKSILQITEDVNHRLIGKILKIFPPKGYTEDVVCKACSGDKKDQPIVGMVVMEKLKKIDDENNKWGNGKILDPVNGNVYSCSIQLLKDNKLLVRGYIGLPLFGRSQHWLRVEDQLS